MTAGQMCLAGQMLDLLFCKSGLVIEVLVTEGVRDSAVIVMHQSTYDTAKVTEGEFCVIHTAGYQNPFLLLAHTHQSVMHIVVLSWHLCKGIFTNGRACGSHIVFELTLL